MTVPAQPKIYHIVHVDRLLSIISNGYLWCDAEVVRRGIGGTTIGMGKIKQRRFTNFLASHSELRVSDCVPFYFCPRSIMLFLIHRNHPEVSYKGGQKPIIHLEADLYSSVSWTAQNNKRWAFTLSNAGANYFEDRKNISQLKEIDWEAVQANKWSGDGVSAITKERKQAEFLMEYSFPWHLIQRIGVHSPAIYQQVMNNLIANDHRPEVEIKSVWYY